MQVNPYFWQNKRVFLTGHTGFKGSWLSLWLQKMGAHVCGYALEPDTPANLFEQARVKEGMQNIFADIRDTEKLCRSMQFFQPEIVIHMAAQPLVRYSYSHPVETYEVNMMGTVSLFEAVRQTEGVKCIVNVTSDKCYENREVIWGYRENEAMGGFDPYSSSKGCAELITNAYRQSFFAAKNIGLASGRSGNVIGGGDWAIDRLVPDIIRACSTNTPLRLRFPNAIRPWQHVLESLSGYLVLAQKLYECPDLFAQGWNFGPHPYDAKPVAWIAYQLMSLYCNLQATPPYHEFIEEECSSVPHEAHSLTLDCSKALNELNWKPQWTLSKALQKTAEWYYNSSVNQDMHAFTLQQITEYYE
jgi:CDP-glucose 4,6-dehydratase